MTSRGFVLQHCSSLVHQSLPGNDPRRIDREESCVHYGFRTMGSHLIEPSNDAPAAKVAEIADTPTPEPLFVVVENATDGRFELRRDGDIVSVADYTERNGRVIVPHVGTRPEYRGRGYAGRLMNGLLEDLRDSGRTIAPLCPFAAAHVRENREWHDLLSPTTS